MNRGKLSIAVLGAMAGIASMATGSAKRIEREWSYDDKRRSKMSERELFKKHFYEMTPPSFWSTENGEYVEDETAMRWQGWQAAKAEAAEERAELVAEVERLRERLRACHSTMIRLHADLDSPAPIVDEKNWAKLLMAQIQAAERALVNGASKALSTNPEQESGK